jgi:hypothetical protein
MTYIFAFCDISLVSAKKVTSKKSSIVTLLHQIDQRAWRQNFTDEYTYVSQVVLSGARASSAEALNSRTQF